MDQKSMILSLQRKGLTSQVIHDDLVATLGAEATAYNTVTKYLRAAQIIPRDSTLLSDTTSLHINESDKAILRALEEFLFSSVRQLSRATHLPITTVYRRLSSKLGFTPRLLRWVGLTYPLCESEGNMGPMFKVPSDDTAGTRNQRLGRHRNHG
jgi:hypothetical protein